MTVNSLGTPPADRSRTVAEWMWPFLPMAVSAFSLSALIKYRLDMETMVLSSPLQHFYAWVYRVFGLAPSVLFFLLALTWSTIWLVTGRLDRPLGRLARLFAMAVMLGVFLNLGDGRVSPGPHKGELGAWLAETLWSFFGYYPSLVLVWAITFASLLLATDFLFFDQFERMRRPSDPAADGEVGVEAAVSDHLRRIEVPARPVADAAERSVIVVPAAAPLRPAAPAEVAAAPVAPTIAPPPSSIEQSPSPGPMSPLEVDEAPAEPPRRRSYFERRRAREEEWLPPSPPDNQEIENAEAQAAAVEVSPTELSPTDPSPTELSPAERATPVLPLDVPPTIAGDVPPPAAAPPLPGAAVVESSAGPSSDGPAVVDEDIEQIEEEIEEFDVDDVDELEDDADAGLPEVELRPQPRAREFPGQLPFAEAIDRAAAEQERRERERERAEAVLERQRAAERAELERVQAEERDQFEREQVARLLAEQEAAARAARAAAERQQWERDQAERAAALREREAAERQAAEREAAERAAAAREVAAREAAAREAAEREALARAAAERGADPEQSDDEPRSFRRDRRAEREERERQRLAQAETAGDRAAPEGAAEPIVPIPRPESSRRDRREREDHDEERSNARQQPLFGSWIDDGLLNDAVEVVTSSRRASATLLQRKLRIDYALAVDVLAALAARGVVELDDDATQGRVVG